MATEPGDLGRAITILVEQGRGVVLDGGISGVVVSELPSGARLAIDSNETFWVLPEGSLTPARFTPSTHAEGEMPNGTEDRFIEAFEVSRHTFEDGLEVGARALGLPAEAVALAFPALPLLRAVLGMSSAFAAKLALRWLLPSERAELMSAIVAVAKDEHMTQDVRDLARHLRG